MDEAGKSKGDGAGNAGTLRRDTLLRVLGRAEARASVIRPQNRECRGRAAGLDAVDERILVASSIDFADLGRSGFFYISFH